MWRVVIIDDDERVLNGLKKVIPWRNLSCKCVGVAKNGKAGLDIIRREIPDIIITDIYMPQKNGLDMIKQLREEGYDGKVVILSGYSDFEYARTAMRLNINDYLSKPSSRDTIEKVLIKIIDQLESQLKKRISLTKLHKKMQLYEPVIEKEWGRSVLTGMNFLNRHTDPPLSIIQNWSIKSHVTLVITYESKVFRDSLFLKNENLFKFATSNIVKETIRIIFDDFLYAEIHPYQYAVCIHMSKSDLKRYNDNLKNLKYELVNNIKKVLKQNVFVTTGGIKSNWEEISKSTKEAIEKLPSEVTSKTIDRSKSIYTTSKSISLLTDTIQINSELYNVIRYADNEKANRIITSIFTQLKNKPFHKPSAIHLGIEIWTLITYSLNDIGISINDIYQDGLDVYQIFSDQNSWETLYEELKEIIFQVCNHQVRTENLSHRKLVEQVCEIMEKKLEENLTLNDIADKLLISRNYLGTVFKKVTGESYRDYLTRLRMKKAKKMILEGNYLIYEVTEKVGYKTPAYFSTVFKKYTGYTPTELIQSRVK